MSSIREFNYWLKKIDWELDIWYGNKQNLINTLVINRFELVDELNFWIIFILRFKE